MSDISKGKLIVICGIDGSGKTTQEHMLAAYLRAAGKNVCCTCQPTDWYRTNPVVRQYLDTGHSSISIESLVLLAATDRLLHIDQVIKPCLEQGDWVVCNRFVYSTYAFFEARGAPMEFVRAANSRVTAPDAGILLLMDPVAAVERVRQRDGARRKFEERNAAYLGRVQEGLRRVWPAGFLVADGMQDATTIHQQVRRYLEDGLLCTDPPRHV